MNRSNLDASESRYVSTAQVAQAIGVSVTTVKRWVDEGILPAHRTAGGHRKLLLGDVLRLVRDNNLPSADLSKLTGQADAIGNDTGELYSQMLRAVDSRDLFRIRDLILNGYQSGVSVEMLADKVIAPIMAHVGDQWEHGKLAIAHEHVITQSVVSALYELQGVLRLNAEIDKPVAIGGAPEHDHYILPTLLTKLTLLDSGWDPINLGPHTPISAFKSAMRELNPTLIWISVTHMIEPEKFLKDYRGLYEEAEANGIAICVGGSGLTPELRTKMPYTTFGDGLSHLAAFARTLHRRPQQPKRGRKPAVNDDINVSGNSRMKSAEAKFYRPSENGNGTNGSGMSNGTSSGN